MTRKRRTRKFHLAHAVSFMGFIGLLISATAWAHQAGIIQWQLPDLGKPVAVATQSTHVALPSSADVAGTEPVGANADDAAIGVTAGASDANCAEQLLGGKAPTLTNAALAEKTRKLCYTGFAVLNSGVTRTPLWSAEHLTAARVRTAQGLPRKNSFHADPNLPKDERAELKDYKGYPYDRGHMAPNADMPDVLSQKECFTLANMVPQNKNNNEQLWAHIEESVRNLAERDADLYVVTGPIFDGDTVQQINDRVMVPTKIFKAVYDVTKKQASVYLVDNADGDKYRVITLEQLEQLAGIEVFPGLPEKVRTAKLELPAPMASDLIN
ncbi:MAG: DNA/RNA non-specific endonuclease [Alphaproteobacteria bacterium]|nr:DNA/RNA non-specific endonuclease [Alphaproteobacteria bacterium]